MAGVDEGGEGFHVKFRLVNVAEQLQQSGFSKVFEVVVEMEELGGEVEGVAAVERALHSRASPLL